HGGEGALVEQVRRKLDDEVVDRCPGPDVGAKILPRLRTRLPAVHVHPHETPRSKRACRRQPVGLPILPSPIHGLPSGNERMPAGSAGARLSGRGRNKKNHPFPGGGGKSKPPRAFFLLSRGP